MTPLLVAYSSAAVVCWALVLYRIRDVLESPADRALRALVSVAALFGAIFPLILLGPMVDRWHGLEGLTGTVWHIAILMAGVTFAEFLLFSAWPETQARRRLRPRRRILTTCCAIIALAWFAADEFTRAHGFRVADASWSAAAWQGAFLLGLGWTLTDGAILAGRAARSAAGDLRTGLRLVAAGSCAGVGFVVAKVLTAVIQTSGYGEVVPGTVLVALVAAAVILICAGALYPGLRARMREVPRWLFRRRLHRQLWPLWHELHLEFPGTAFRIARIPERSIVDALLLRRLRRRYYRRTIEIRDMLRDLRRWTCPATAARAQQVAVAEGLADDDTELFVHAAVLQHAIEAKRRGESGTTTTPVLALVDHLSLDEDARWLVRVHHARNRFQHLLATVADDDVDDVHS